MSDRKNPLKCKLMTKNKPIVIIPFCNPQHKAKKNNRIEKLCGSSTFFKRGKFAGGWYLLQNKMKSKTVNSGNANNWFFDLNQHKRSHYLPITTNQ